MARDGVRIERLADDVVEQMLEPFRVSFRSRVDVHEVDPRRCAAGLVSAGNVVLEIFGAGSQSDQPALGLPGGDLTAGDDTGEESEIERRGIPQLRLDDDVVAGERVQLLARVLLNQDRQHLVGNHGDTRELLTREQGETDIHHDQDVDPHLPGNVYGYVLRYPAVHEEAAVAFDRCEDSGRGEACAHRGRQISRTHHDGLARFQIRRHGAKTRGQLVEARDVRHRQSQPAQGLAELLSLDQPFRQLDVAAAQPQGKLDEKVLILLFAAKSEIFARRPVAKGVLPVQRSHDRLDLTSAESACI